MRVLFSRFCLIISFWIAAVPSTAAEVVRSNWIGDSSIAEARLISAVTAVGNLLELPMALEFRLAPGWKIYWRTPGEAGLPPSLDLTINGHPVNSIIRWPVPKRFNSFGFDNYGYEKLVVLPIIVSGFTPGALMDFSGQIDALACADICVPISGNVKVMLPVGSALASEDARVIAQANALVPREIDNPLVKIKKVWQSANTIQIEFSTPVEIDDIFIEGIEGVGFKQPRMEASKAIISIDAVKVPDLVGREIMMTTVFGDQFIEQRELISSVVADLSKDEPNSKIFFIALLGGLILNLMPCVLPVLAIKVASVLETAGQQKPLIRKRFLSTSAGIVASFLLLATTLALTRAAGVQVGWGVQFQSPTFLTVMVLMVSVFVLIMLDKFALPVPKFVQYLASRSRVATSSRFLVVGDFVAGMLATVLATPCSAPFVGIAVGFALTGSTLDLFGIFLAMGVGLAIPWILITIAPGAINFLPKPGSWMVWLKRILALFLACTAIWLSSILFSISSTVSFVIAGISIFLVILGLAQANPRYSRLIVCTGLAIMVLHSFNPHIILNKDKIAVSTNDEANKTSSAQMLWQNWRPNLVSELVAEGKMVFVDVTAAWCITCKANKSLVIEQDPTATFLKQLVNDGDLVLLRADWTQPNDEILTFLTSHNRYGIPFNVVYGPSTPQGVILGELLTAESVIAALNEVRL